MNSNSGGGSFGITGASCWNCFKISCCFCCCANEAGADVGADGGGFPGGPGTGAAGAAAGAPSASFPSLISLTLYW